MKEKNNHFGYLMTDEQAFELGEMLTEDIIERYDNESYYDRSIIEDFAQDNELEGK